MAGTVHCDFHRPSYIQSAVDGTTTYTGETLYLYGAVGVSIMCVCDATAAGTLYIDGSNQLEHLNGPQAQYTAPVWVSVANQTVAAGQSVLITNSLVDDLTAMHIMRCRFVSSAAGNVQVSVNMRRVTY